MCATHISQFKSKLNILKTDKDKFFTFFNNDSSIEESFLVSSWDFSWHIVSFIAPYLSQLQQIRSPIDSFTCLELGCGGGRLCFQASRYFKNVIGVDIHENLDLVQDELQRRGVRNVDLRVCDGSSLPVESSSIDVAYSFIVFQHLERMEIVLSYLREIYRSLKHGGIFCVYFGRFKKFSGGEGFSAALFSGWNSGKFLSAKGVSGTWCTRE